MAGRETQASISRWAEETFGPAGTDFRIATRMNEEVAELLRAIAAGKPVKEIMDEAADVAIVATRLSERLEVPFFAELDKEAAIFRLQDCIVAVPSYIALEIHRSMLNAMNQILDGGRAGSRASLLSIAYYLAQLAYAFKGDIFEHIDAKMTVNRGREWRRDGTGHGYHVRQGSAAEARAAG